MPPRSLWSGSITFGLVNVPVRIYSAVHEHKLQFHLVHEPDDGPIGYQKICKLEDKPVPNDEIVKAFEYKKGELVQLTDEDFEAVQVEGQRTIDLEDFVPYDDIDPTFFAHTYLVGAAGRRREDVRAARPRDGGVGPRRHRQVRDAQPPVPRLPARARDRLLTLEQMHFADEVDLRRRGRSPSRLPSVSRSRELDMALDLITAFAGTWEPKKYKDTYTAALRKVVRAKRAGQGGARAARARAGRAPADLMEALRASVERVQGSRTPRGKRRAPAKRR